MKRIIGFLLMLPSMALAQYAAEAPLPAITADGFYSVPLPADVTSRMTAGCGNVRIVDEAGKEVPYIVVVERPQFSKTEFIEYKIRKEQRKNCCTIVTMENTKGDRISNMMLEVKNADVTKMASLRGSDDKKMWYALKEQMVVGGFSNPDATSELEIVSFPLSEYKYYQLTFDDSTSSPFNILRAGYYNTNTVNGEYTEIPGITVASADSVSDKTTWALITMPGDIEFVDKYQFDIEGPKFYYRKAYVYARDEYMVKGVRKYSLNEIYNFDITSTHETSLNISQRPKDLRIKIVNDDNPPLKVKGVRAWQLKRSLTAWLASGHTYKVVIADRNTAAPTYDLVKFQDSIPKILPALTVGVVKNFEQPRKEEVSPTYFTNRNIIWVAIIGVIAILAFMSLRMLREKDKEEARK